MRVLVTGASGVVGTQLVPRLVARGHDVVATTRSAGKLDTLRALGAEPVVLDGLDEAAVGETVARVAPEAIVHEMTALGGKPDLRHFDRWFAVTNELRVRGTANLLAAARATGVARFVVQSYTGWNNDDAGGTGEDVRSRASWAAVRRSAAMLEPARRILPGIAGRLDDRAKRHEPGDAARNLIAREAWWVAVDCDDGTDRL